MSSGQEEEKSADSNLRPKGFTDKETEQLLAILREQGHREWLWKHIKRFGHFLTALAVFGKTLHELWKAGWLG